MDTILAPGIDGIYQELFGRTYKGLFVHRLEEGRFLFRHSASGLSLFHFLGTVTIVHELQGTLADSYDFHRDSTWVLKGQAEIHRRLMTLGLRRRWLFRAWHYEYQSS